MEVAASIAGLLTAGAQISKALQHIIQGSVNAPSLAQTIDNEIHDFRFVLSKLQPMVLGSTPLAGSRASIADIGHLTLTLARCVCTLSELETHVDRLIKSGKMDIRHRIRWAWMEPTLMALIQRLQHHKLSLTLILLVLKR